MKPYRLQEDKLPPKLDIKFSFKISNIIRSINANNQNNIEGLNQWREYLKGMRDYISNSVIGWDNTDRYSRQSDELSNGTRFIWDFGYNVGYTILADYYTGKPFMYVFMANLNPEEFGLKVPAKLKENKLNGVPMKKIYRLTESDMCKIVRNVIQEVMANLYEKQY